MRDQLLHVLYHLDHLNFVLEETPVDEKTVVCFEMVLARARELEALLVDELS